MRKIQVNYKKQSYDNNFTLPHVWNNGALIVIKFPCQKEHQRKQNWVNCFYDPDSYASCHSGKAENPPNINNSAMRVLRIGTNDPFPLLVLFYRDSKHYSRNSLYLQHLYILALTVLGPQSFPKVTKRNKRRNRLLPISSLFLSFTS